MKTKVTYWSFVRGFVATIVAVIGFALVSVGQTYTVEATNLTCGSIKSCGSFVYVEISVDGVFNYKNFIIKKNGEVVTPGSVSGKLAPTGWTQGQYYFTEGGTYNVVLNTEDNTLTAQSPDIEVCGLQVGKIGTKNSSGYYCLNSYLLSAPSVMYPGTKTAADYDQGWEILETGAKYVSVEGAQGSQYLVDASGNNTNLSDLYGKTIRYYVAEKTSSEEPKYSNEIKLMSKPTGKITIPDGGYYICPNEKILNYPSVSYDANGTRVTITKWQINRIGVGYEDYNGQVVDPAIYNAIYYRVHSVECGDNSKPETRVTPSYYSPIMIEFEEDLSSDVHCANTVSATVVDGSGNDVTNGNLYMYWTKDGVFEKRTTGNHFDFSFDCDEESGNIALGAYFIDPSNGCKSTVSQTVNVTHHFNEYVYNGSTGDASNVTNLDNWCKLEDGSPLCSVHPSNFTSDNCRFIISKSDVVLKSGESWTISGLGSKVIVGDGENTSSFVVKGNLTCDNGVNVEKKATLDIQSSNVPVLGKLNQENSTVKYSGASAQTIRTAMYNNLMVEGSARTVTFPEGDVLISGTFSPSSTPTYSMNSKNTIAFCAKSNQNIPAFTYMNIDIENGYDKTLLGDITIKNSLIIGAITTLKAEDKTIDLDGPGNVIVQAAGKFDAGTSTVKYTSTGSSNVAALNYYNLDLGTGKRVYATSGVIGVANNFTPSTGEDVVTGSTVEFNGTAAKQNIPAADFYNLTFSNSKGIYIMDDASGDVNVDGILTLKQGIVDASNGNRKLVVRNTDPNAVSTGSGNANVNGRLYRYIKANLTNSSDRYLFPVGRGSGVYRPLELSNITTGSTPVLVNFGARTSGSVGEYWGFGGNVIASVSVTVGDRGGKNAIEGCDNTSFTTTQLLNGTVSGNSVINSDASNLFTYYRLTTRSSSPVTYTYDCSGDVSVLSNWSLTSGSGDAVPASFDINDATWVINCPATTSGSIIISGGNSKLQITSSGSLTVEDGGNVTVGGELLIDGDLTVESGASMSVLGKYSHTGTNVINIKNYGTMSFFTDVEISRTYFDNYGDFVMSNANFSMKAYSESLPRDTRFSNYGQMHLTNSAMTIPGADNVAKRPTFENIDGALVAVDNTMCSNKNVYFGDRSSLEEGQIDLQEGSTLWIKGCDFEISHENKEHYISSTIIIEDGDFLIHNSGGGGGKVNLLPSGAVYLRDTDNSGDGLLRVDGGGGGYNFSVDGTLYAEGVVYDAGGGGNVLYVNRGATAFIGDMGASIVGNNNTSIQVLGGGTLNYCGNITPGADNVGLVASGGTLNYAESYYKTESPVHQSDFTGDESDTNPMFSSVEECSAAFKGKVSNLLPVELTMLYGICKDNVVELHWQTATESNNELFVVLRSFDGVNFEELGTVLGAGTTTEVQNYAFYDNDEKTGIVYYKLRQIDFDGKTKDSKIVAVQTCGKNAQFSIAEDEIVVTFKNPEEKNYVIVTSLTGKIVFSKPFENVPEARIASPRIKGIYIISVIDKSQITSEKFIR